MPEPRSAADNREGYSRGVSGWRWLEAMPARQEISTVGSKRRARFDQSQRQPGSEALMAISAMLPCQNIQRDKVKSQHNPRPRSGNIGESSPQVLRYDEQLPRSVRDRAAHNPGTCVPAFLASPSSRTRRPRLFVRPALVSCRTIFQKESGSCRTLFQKSVDKLSTPLSALQPLCCEKRQVSLRSAGFTVGTFTAEMLPSRSRAFLPWSVPHGDGSGVNQVKIRCTLHLRSKPHGVRRWLGSKRRATMAQV
jgi:hypothetical protein